MSSQNWLTYKVIPYPAAKEQLRRLKRDEPRIYRTVRDALIELASDPYPPTAEQLEDELATVWRIKIDGWRLLYEVDEQNGQVKIIKIVRRNQDTYRKLT